MNEQSPNEQSPTVAQNRGGPPGGGTQRCNPIRVVLEEEEESLQLGARGRTGEAAIPLELFSGEDVGRHARTRGPAESRVTSAPQLPSRYFGFRSSSHPPPRRSGVMDVGVVDVVLAAGSS
jgi:hypothetical protein